MYETMIEEANARVAALEETLSSLNDKIPEI